MSNNHNHTHPDEEAPLLPQSQSPPPPPPPSRFSQILTHGLSTPFERTLAALVILLFLSTTLAFGLFAGEVLKGGDRGSPTRPGNPTRPGGPGQGNDKICLTPDCVKVAASVLSSLDLTVDPCTDFYSFANGGWLKSHDIPEGKGLFGVGQQVAERNKRTILSILSTPPSGTLPQTDQQNLNHLRAFYASCQNEHLLDERGAAPLLEIVEDVIGAWRGTPVQRPEVSFVQQQMGPETGPRPPREEGLTNVLMLLHSLSVPALFTTYNEGDVKRAPSTLTLWLTQAELGLPSKEYYEDEAALTVYREVIRKTLESIYHDLGEKVDSQLAEEVLRFETALARASLGGVELYDPQQSYNLVNSTELATLFPLIAFPNYFASFLPRPKYPDPIIVTGPSYLRNVTFIIENTHSRVLEGYFVFRTAQEFGKLLGSKQVVRQELDWLKNYLVGAERGTSSTRSDVCLESLLGNYGFLIGRYFVQEAFSGDSKEFAEEVIVAVIDAFKKRLPELSWLDDESRAAAEEKANAMTHKIGYPTTPNTLDPDSLARYYALNLPIRDDDFFGNIVRSQIADEKRRWALLGRKVDKGMWEMVPSEVNAYFNPSTNEIAFPAGILQPPYFSKDWPEYLAFGAFGSVSGHEVSHGFDGNGRQYNKDGMLVDWWTNSTVARFEERRQCFLEQYREYTIKDAKGKVYHVDSDLTDGEDLADAGGLVQSYRAWEERLTNGKGEERNYLLPGLTAYSREQLFYISFAQSWARKVTPAEAVKRILTDPHSPTNYRVIGTLSNNAEFSRLFGCKAGQPMSRVDKCSIW